MTSCEFAIVLTQGSSVDLHEQNATIVDNVRLVTGIIQRFKRRYDKSTSRADAFLLNLPKRITCHLECHTRIC